MTMLSACISNDIITNMELMEITYSTDLTYDLFFLQSSFLLRKIFIVI